MNQYIFKFAYRAGLHDATAQQAYPCKEGEQKKLRENKDAIKIVQSYIDSILNGAPEDFYEVAEKLVASFNAFESKNHLSGKFLFGNAQKLINITAKFMYLTVYANSHLRANFECCHCPLDRIMGRFVKKEAKKLTKPFPHEIEDIIKNKGWKVWDGTWSKISEDDYRNYQTMVTYLAEKEGLFPLEYDYRHFE